MPFVRCEAPSLWFQRSLFEKGEVRKVTQDVVDDLAVPIAKGDISVHEKDPSAPAKPKRTRKKKTT